MGILRKVQSLKYQLIYTKQEQHMPQGRILSYFLMHLSGWLKYSEISLSSYFGTVSNKHGVVAAHLWRYGMDLMTSEGLGDSSWQAVLTKWVSEYEPWADATK